VTTFQQGALALGLADGRALIGRFSFVLSHDKDGRKIEPKFKADPPVTLDPSGRPITRLARAMPDSGPVFAAATGPREITLVTLKKKKGLMGDGKLTEVRRTISLGSDGEVSALAMDNRAEDLFAGLKDGRVIRVDLRDIDNPKPAVPVACAKSGTAITALDLLNGDRTLVIGDASGEVSAWQVLRSEEGSYYLARCHEFNKHEAAVTAFSPSLRNKGFISTDAKGTIHLNYATTSSTLAEIPAGEAGAVALTPKADGIVLVGASGKLVRWDVDNKHPEASVQSLFGKVWYEGYPEPEAVWQSTGATDDFEPKFGLSPLIFGTLKGTFYALIMAVPLALLSALYVSQFMHPALRQNIKPLIEVMAALPSVVLGFIAALWLAPNIERRIPGIILLPIVETILILLTVAAYRSVPLGIRQRFKHGSEVVLIIPVVLIGAALSFWLGGLLEMGAMGGDYQAFFLRTMGLSYDQRNSVVVGLAMGFAVIPIIFTIAEDSLSNVPPYLAAGSLALGATRWQTAIKVILPSASPGIFSAIIGFGRAVGETMIVLMATGNTPITSWNPFKGFRALSANIAVELPEAPEGDTLFRVLFLAAFLLFLMTFTVNTLAEMIRLRLRKKYQSL
jgi:phosphate transport system permease protein